LRRLWPGEHLRRLDRRFEHSSPHAPHQSSATRRSAPRPQYSNGCQTGSAYDYRARWKSLKHTPDAPQHEADQSRDLSVSQTGKGSASVAPPHWQLDNGRCYAHHATPGPSLKTTSSYNRFSQKDRRTRSATKANAQGSDGHRPGPVRPFSSMSDLRAISFEADGTYLRTASAQVIRPRNLRSTSQ